MTPFRHIFAIDLRTLALFRVALGVVIIADLLSRARDLTAHYSDAGIFPRAAALGEFHWEAASLHLLSGSSLVQALLFSLAGLLALALIAGYRTRVVVVLSWLLACSIRARNPTILQGGDDLLRLLLFWAMFLPLGARYSVDAALDRDATDRPNAFFSPATVALEIQCMSVYFFGALLKSDPVWLPEGSAVYYALQLDYLATPVAIWLRQFPELLQGLTYFVWSLQMFGSVLMFSPFLHLPLRLALQAGFMAMHVGFFLCLAIGLFPLISVVSLLAFTPGAVWNRIETVVRTPQRCGVRLYYDADCGFCLKTCRLLRVFLLLEDTPIRRAQDDPAIYALMLKHNSWVVLDHDDVPYVRWEALILVFRRSVLFAPLGRLMALGSLPRWGDRVYEAVARNRARLGELTAVWLPWRDVHMQPSRIAGMAVGALIVLVFAHNLTTIKRFGLALPHSLAQVRDTLRLNQQWSMFAPAPSRHDGWYVVEGQLADARIVDVYHDRLVPPDDTRPALISADYPNYRWRKFLINMALASNAAWRPHYARYLCQRWNGTHAGDQKLIRLKVYFNHEEIEPDYQRTATERLLLLKQECTVEAAPADSAKAPAEE